MSCGKLKDCEMKRYEEDLTCKRYTVTITCTTEGSRGSLHYDCHYLLGEGWVRNTSTVKVV